MGNAMASANLEIINELKDFPVKRAEKPFTQKAIHCIGKMCPLFQDMTLPLSSGNCRRLHPNNKNVTKCNRRVTIAQISHNNIIAIA
jgi:hypothetical protein